MKMVKTMWIVLLTAVIGVAGCDRNTESPSASTTSQDTTAETAEEQTGGEPSEESSEAPVVEQIKEAKKDEEQPTWGYSGDIGPENWGKLGPEFAMCGLGKNQSPVEVSGALELTSAPAIQVDYPEGVSTWTHDGHALVAEVPEGNTLTVGDRQFDLLQFHFHTPAEHDVDEKEYPLEVHFVHKNDDGVLAVLGVLLEEGEANEQLTALLEETPTEKGDSVSLEETDFDLTALLPDSRTAYRYSGSLTTPPCSEGVHWNLLTEPVTASAEQIETLTSAIGHDNDRPIQPLNARRVVR